MRVALVTGATGLVGTHVVRRLQEEGWETRALVRDAARAGALSRSGVHLATGDILEPTGFARAARGCDVVFHTAAAVTPAGGWEAFRRPNVEGTRNAVAAAAGAGARLVHVSSVAVYGESSRYRDGELTDEDAPLEALPESAHYARSKRESEALVLDAHQAGRLWATAVRPAVIYGPNDRQFVPRVARLLRYGVAPLIGGGQTRLSVVHAANVADGMIRAAAMDAAGGRAYNLANDDDITVADFFRLAAIGLDTRLRTVTVPRIVARAAIGLFSFIAPLVVGNRFNAVTSGSIDFLTRDNPFTSDRARKELHWTPVVRPEVGVPDAFRWWLAHR
ncbi:MAG: NAD-dependent epimerase/dehydratase family protein [Gemmatimonadaceae bacterium]|nr:NAD-dependent epimerase/dehydratase family protein [Gemmatimonadaceae bacterium]